MLKKIIILNKKEGETPLECLERFRAGHKLYRDIKMTYAGRLDPMASGLMLIVVGEEIKNKEKYLKLDKQYEFEVLFDFATDTYDILGKVISLRRSFLRNEAELGSEIKNNLKYFTGKFKQKFPLYSSKNIKRVRAGEEVEFSEKQVNVRSLKLIKIKSINSKLLLNNIEKRIKKVNGDFRQAAILKIWHKNLTKNSNKYFIASFKIACSSGTYVRSIAHELGERLSVPALAFSIKRTKVGKNTRVG